jgi:hypothetical protein
MHKSFGILVFFLGFSQLLSGQTVIVSEEIAIKNDVRYELLSFTDGQTRLFRDRVFSYDILGFDDALRNIWTKELLFEKKRVSIIGLINNQESFTILYHFREKMAVYIVGRTYDHNAEEIKADTLMVEDGLLNNPDYYLAKSDDEKTVLVFRTERNKDVVAFGIGIDSLQVLWSMEKVFDSEESNREFRGAFISNDARGYLIFEVNNRWQSRKEHKLEFVSLLPDEVKYDINLSGTLFFDIKMTLEDESNTIYGSCSYSERADNRTLGIVTFSLNLNNGATIVNAYDFDDNLVKDIYGNKTKKGKGIKDLVIRHLQPRQDGGMVVFGEISKEYSRRPSFASTPATAYSRKWVDYYFEDIVAFSFHPDGKSHWSEVLHKRQYSQDDDAMYSSFYVFELPSQLRIIFNDEIRSENTISEYIMTGRGLEERNSLMSTDYQNLKIRFREAKQIDNRTILVPSLRGNRLAIVKITYDDV